MTSCTITKEGRACVRREVTKDHQLHVVVQFALAVHKHLKSACIMVCRIYKGILQIDQISIWQKSDMPSNRKQSRQSIINKLLEVPSNVANLELEQTCCLHILSYIPHGEKNVWCKNNWLSLRFISIFMQITIQCTNQSYQLRDVVAQDSEQGSGTATFVLVCCLRNYEIPEPNICTLKTFLAFCISSFSSKNHRRGCGSSPRAKVACTHVT